MEKRLYIYLLIFFNCIACPNYVLAQNNRAKYLQVQINYLIKQNKINNDTIIFNKSLELANIYNGINTDSALRVLQFLHPYAIKSKNGLPKYYCELGRVNLNKGDFLISKINFNSALLILKQNTGINQSLMFDLFIGLAHSYWRLEQVDSAFLFAQKALNLSKNSNNLTQQGVAYNKLAVIYTSQGNYSLGLDYAFKALSILQKDSNHLELSDVYSTIGRLYKNQNEFKKSLDYYFKSLQIVELHGNKQALAGKLLGISVVYIEFNKFKDALQFSLRALKLTQELGLTRGIALNLGNLGEIYFGLGDYQKSVYYFNEAYQLNVKFGFKQGQSIVLGGLGQVYLKKKNHPLAEKYLTQAIELAERYRYKRYLNIFYKSTAQLHAETNDFNKALIFHKKHVQINDSLNNEANRKASIQKEMQYEFDKLCTADSLKAVEEKRITILKIEQEKTQKYYLGTGLFLIIVFALSMVKRYRLTSRQKNLISEQKMVVEMQKKLVDEKQKEILDSIRYAKRIQQALLPNEKYIHKNLNSKV